MIRWFRKIRPAVAASPPSRTAAAVAAVRAQLDRPHTPEGDPEAQCRLCSGMRTFDVSWLRSHVAARTRFFDERVLEALTRGIRQVVVVGAGYDDRALRFRAPGVRFFEVDHPVTQADKQTRLLAAGARTDRLTLVPADIAADDVGAALAAARHDAAQPSLFICEGLLVYLEEAAIVRLLSALAARARSGSVLAASLAVHARGLPSADVVAAANGSRPRTTATTEPWRTILPAEDHLELLRRAGWEPVQVLDDADLTQTAQAGRSLLVAALR